MRESTVASLKSLLEDAGRIADYGRTVGLRNVQLGCLVAWSVLDSNIHLHLFIESLKRLAFFLFPLLNTHDARRLGGFSCRNTQVLQQFGWIQGIEMNHVFAVTCRTSSCGLRAAGPIFKLLPKYSISQIHDQPSSTQRTEREKSLQFLRRWPKSLRFCILSLGPKKLPYQNCLIQSTVKADFSSTAGGAERRRKSSSPTPKHNKPGTRPSHVHTDERASSKQGFTEDYQSKGKRQGKNALSKFPQDVITKVFGPTVSQELGNKVLRNLQLQRTTGTLDQELPEPRLDDHLIANGLAWLRANYPVDEDAAIIKRIEEEESKVNNELIANAERIGLYKPQQDAEKTGVYGKSGLDAIRKYHKDRAIKTQADEIRNAAGDSAVLQTPTGRAVLARRSESAEWVKRYKEKAEFLKASEPAKMSKFRRLFPSAVFCVSIVGLSILFAQNYVPPPRQARLWPDMPPAAATVLTIIAMNITVLMVWRLAPPMWGFMNRYFLLIAGWPRPISLLGNCFSHQKLMHLAGNMVALWLVGTQGMCEEGSTVFCRRRLY